MARAQLHPHTILLIEDEPLIRMATAAILEDAGHDVLQAECAEEALSMLKQHEEIEIVITDVQMPGMMDGLALVEIISRDYPDIRSLVTSGRIQIEQVRACGAYGFLPKPYSARTIVLLCFVSFGAL